MDEQEQFNNKLIDTFKSKEVKETFSSIFAFLIYIRQNNLKKKKNIKRYHLESEESKEEIEYEKENTNLKKKKHTKNRNKRYKKKTTKLKKDQKLLKEIKQKFQINLL